MATQRRGLVNRNNGRVVPDDYKSLLASKRGCPGVTGNGIIILLRASRKSTSETCDTKEMPATRRQIAALFAIALLATGLSGCAGINEKLAAGVSDAIPAWAGGMPADAPPRPGTAKYDEFMRERERKRLMPAAERGDETKPPADSQEAVH